MDMNSLLSTGVVLVLMGSLFAYFRAVPGMVYRKIKSYFVFTIEIHQNDSAFNWFMSWLNEHPSTNKSKTLAVRTEMSDGETRVTFTPLGVHFFKYEGNYIWINRSREKQTNNGSFVALYETLTVTTLARNRGFLEDLVKQTQKHNERTNRGKVVLYSSHSDYWSMLGKRIPRSIDTVILPEETKKSTLDDVKWFLANQDWYKARGVPYRRGFLLYGPPGNGKTSLVFAVASELQYNVAILNLSDANISDTGLLGLLSDIPEKCVVVAEDIDTVFEGRESKVKGGKITFSGLLNAIDGVASSEGRILFMTTNRIETLDPALIRPGRADRQIEIKAPNEALRKAMYLRFYPNDIKKAEAFATRTDTQSAAAVQELLIMGER